MFLVMALLAAQAQAGGKPPTPLIGRTWMTDDDYPAEARRLGHAGTVGWQLQVDASGRPSGCDIFQSSGYPGLDRATCEILLRRVRFKPARDADGKPTAGTFKGRFTWKLPASRRAASAALPIAMGITVSRLPADYRQPVHARLQFEPDGGVRECAIEESSGNAQIDRLTCEQLRQSAAKDAEDRKGSVTSDSTYVVSFRTEPAQKP